MAETVVVNTGPLIALQRMGGGEAFRRLLDAIQYFECGLRVAIGQVGHDHVKIALGCLAQATFRFTCA